MKQFFENIPREIEEAALIDGATPITTFYRIILPMATPALGAPQGMWNEFIKAVVVLSGQQANHLFHWVFPSSAVPMRWQATGA